MTRDQALLKCAEEECVEVAQRLSKAIRFGRDEKQPGQELTNVERVQLEYWDLQAALALAGINPFDVSERMQAHLKAKYAKIEKYLKYSIECGQVRAE